MFDHEELREAGLGGNSGGEGQTTAAISRFHSAISLLYKNYRNTIGYKSYMKDLPYQTTYAAFRAFSTHSSYQHRDLESSKSFRCDIPHFPIDTNLPRNGLVDRFNLWHCVDEHHVYP